MADSTIDLKSASTAISNGIGSLHREHYGRGADRIRTLIHLDVVLTTLEDCFTPVEHKMVAEGAFRQVRETRIMFQDSASGPLRRCPSLASKSAGRAGVIGSWSEPIERRSGWLLRSR